MSAPSATEKDARSSAGAKLSFLEPRTKLLAKTQYGELIVSAEY